MRTTHFFEHLLQLEYPYRVSGVEHRQEEGDNGVYIMIEVCPSYRPEGATVHDYEDRTWRHLDLFQYPCYVRCRVPKFKYKGLGVRTLEVPWARPGSGFTLLFEDIAISLVKLHGCVSKVAAQLKEYPQRLWSIVWHYAKEEKEMPKDMSHVTRIGMDETSKRKGHDYVTCFLDMDTGELLSVVEGKGAETVTEFVKSCGEHGLDPEKVTDVSVDMSPAFGAGLKEELPKAKVSYDKFHVSQLVQRAFDTVRKSCARKHGQRFNKWIFFKAYEKLSQDERQQLESLLMSDAGLAAAYEMKNSFKKLWEQPGKEQAGAYLSYWADFARTLKKKSMTSLANTLDKHYEGIIQYFESGLTNATLEGFNSKIQAMKRNARGYRDTETLLLMIRWHCAKPSRLPTQII